MKPHSNGPLKFCVPFTHGRAPGDADKCPVFQNSFIPWSEEAVQPTIVMVHPVFNTSGTNTGSIQPDTTMRKQVGSAYPITGMLHAKGL